MHQYCEIIVMKTYSVQQMASFSGVTVRTLHHYDTIGLLKPLPRHNGEKRLYDRSSLYRLQQILLYREAGFSLNKIGELLNEGAPTKAALLRKQRVLIEQEGKRLQTLLNTIDRTIEELEKEKFMLTEKELYDGFSQEETQKMRAEVSDRWGADELKTCEEHLLKKTPGEFKALKDEGTQLVKSIAQSMTLPVDHPEVQQKIDSYFVHMKEFRPLLDLEQFRQLAHLYVEDDRFTNYYEQHATGLARFISDAILYFTKE